MNDDQTEMRWAYSRNEEGEYSEAGSREEAIAELDGEDGYVGTIRRPTPPENFWSADEWLENVAGQDQYSHEWGEDWPGNPTKEQLEELEAEVRKVLGAWLDRHDLRPKFFLVYDAEYIAAKADGAGDE